MIRVGIIGSGRHGSRYAQHILEDCEGLRLSAVSRRSPTGLEQARAWGARYFKNWQDLVDSDEVDAVICAVPPVLNHQIAEACSIMEKPLLVEKPLASSPEEGRGMIRVMAESLTGLTVAQTLRFNPVIRKLREELRHRGRLHTVYANQRLEPSPHDWLDDPSRAGAGVSYHTAVHVFDALHFITGLKITSVYADCRTRKMVNCEDSIHVLFEMEGGVTGTADFSKVSRARSGRYEFVFDDSQLYGDQIHGGVAEIAESRVVILEQYKAEPTIVPLLQDWQRFIEGRGPNPVEPGDGLYAICVSESCLNSSRTGRRVDVE